MLNSSHNPDILTCIANLSSDEVFTPPNIANQMLDNLPKAIWKDETATFLDPVSKSGVFLREITKRLIDGLAKKIPNLEDRIEHILKKQVFGIGITELTALISRRSLYCSKHANGKYSIVNFNDEEGNVKYFETQHVWAGGKRCKYCGVSKAIYNRDEQLELYAYSFIHEDKPEELFKMKFDVIIGNPPYQMSDGGLGGSATPIYDKFVKTAIKLNPKYLTMVIPARWFTGGRGLNDFRKDMLNDRRIAQLVDFPYSSECFPDVEIKGGICYFLWKKDYKGECKITTITQDAKNISTRPLLEAGLNVFVRYHQSIAVIRKVQKLTKDSFQTLVSSLKPFGLRTYIQGNPKKFNNSFKLLCNGKKISYIAKKDITQNKQLIDCHKIFISRAYGAGERFPHQILNKPLYGEPGLVCTETYLCIGPFPNKEESLNAISYINTKFFRFMVLNLKNTQDAPKSVYELAPLQNFSEEWSDEKLFKKYALTEGEIKFIDNMIRPMK